MSKIELAPHHLCSACGACVQACPRNSIVMKNDRLDCRYPTICKDTCVECGLCAKACPVLTPPEPFSQGRVYAVWNTNLQLRTQAASGGVATAIYQYALKNGWKSFGVRCLPEGKAEYIPICSQKDIESCRNSKYVYSDIAPILQQIKQLLVAGEKVVLPALPCQIAAVLTYLGGRHNNLILVDIVCHGVCPSEYLQQHIAAIEKKRHVKADAVSFRDPQFGTSRYMFTVRQCEQLAYHALVDEGDVYQLGYHRSLSYRENCYNCIYARPERFGDMTISDFSGLGAIEPFGESKDSVSCVIVSSVVGERLLNQLCAEGMLVCQSRPSQEAFNYERQLKKPSKPHKNREKFVAEYVKTGLYDSAAAKALRGDIIKNQMRRLFCVDKIRQGVSKVVPKNLKTLIRKVIK